MFPLVRGQSGADAVAWFETKLREINRGAFRAISEAAEAGENITKHHIATRGTAKSGKRGRIDSGAMHDLVGSEAHLINADLAEGKFGWLGESPRWAEYQELGTEYIQPMYALADAAEEVGEDYVEEIRKVIKNA